MNEEEKALIRNAVFRFALLVGLGILVCFMAHLAHADKPPTVIVLGAGEALTYEEAKQCITCHQTYAKCVASVLTGEAPTAEVMDFIDTCKTLELKCTKDYECLNSN